MEKLLNSAGFVAIVSTIGALGVAYIANIMAKKRRDTRPPDRMATIFDGYEKLISQQQEEIVRKGTTINALEVAMTHLEEQLEETRVLLSKARSELAESKDHNQELREQLTSMRKDYKLSKHDPKS